MTIIIAMDSFKSTLTAYEACQIIAESITKTCPNVKIVKKPMADGGEGTAKAMIEADNGKWIKQKVTGPLPQMQVDAGFAWFEHDKTALVEMACASGIELISKEQLNPLKTTTYGTGQLIKAALDHGAKKILLAVGGSATVDGGIGAAMALGWKFLDENGDEITLGGAGIGRIEKIIPPKNLNSVPVEVLCDVDNPLCGPHGAAKIYGPQKGATPEMVEQLENSLTRLAKLIDEQLGCNVKNIPGAGAAGGLAAGAIAFLGANIVSGIETVMARSHLAEELESADWVITGEGSFDRQSLFGKVVSGIAKMAVKSNTKIAIIAGQVKVAREDYEKLGITDAIACQTEDMFLDYALANSKSLLQKAVEKFTKKYILKT